MGIRKVTNMDTCSYAQQGALAVPLKRQKLQVCYYLSEQALIQTSNNLPKNMVWLEMWELSRESGK